MLDTRLGPILISISSIAPRKAAALDPIEALPYE
jgi:hypothetical protein